MKNQEKMKEILEQIRSKANGNNVAKASVEENMMENRNSRSITQGEEEEMFTTQLSTSLASLTTYSYQTAPDDATTVGSGGAIIGLMPPNYYFAEFRMDAIKAQDRWWLSVQELVESYLSFTPQNVSDGYCTFTIVNSEGDTVGTWNNNNGGEIALLVEDVYNGEEDEIYFKLMPTRGINGMVGFPLGNVTLKKDSPFREIVGISITTPPKKVVYLVGETFDPSGMVVTARYNDGAEKEIVNYSISNTGNLEFQERVMIMRDSYTIDTDVRVVRLLSNEVRYGLSDLQEMDIYYFDGLEPEDAVPVVITIHGGSWDSGDKATSHYCNKANSNKDTSDFITNICNCVHVNMNYRLTEGYPGGNNITYVEMLADIQSVINYLNVNASAYHINPNKIALMGHSAGGHLALLYAYSTAGEYSNSMENPVKLVISEAGPTYFATSPSNPNPVCDIKIQAMVGSNNTGDLYNASPLKYANSSSPYTVLAYGNGLPAAGYNYGDENGNGILDDGDMLIPFTQATVLQNVLGKNNCSLFELTGIHHNQFFEDGDNDYEDSVFPGSTDEMVREYYYGKEENGQITVAGLQQLIYTHLFGNS